MNTVTRQGKAMGILHTSEMILSYISQMRSGNTDLMISDDTAAFKCCMCGPIFSNPNQKQAWKIERNVECPITK